MNKDNLQEIEQMKKQDTLQVNNDEADLTSGLLKGKSNEKDIADKAINTNYHQLY